MAQIHYLKGDIFDSKAQVIVNTVNCKGVMGKGLALAFKQKYPDMFPVYENECKTGRLTIGRLMLYRKSAPWILNFPTKNHWRNPSKLEYLEKGLAFLIDHYKKAGITSIAFPKLGAQNGQLSWDDVGPLMAKYLSKLDITVYIYIAEGDQEYQYDPIEELKIEARMFQNIEEIMLSPERLQQEVGLSAREAKKVADICRAAPFKSFSDLENAEASKTSKEKIKKFIRQYNMPELAGMPEKKATSTRDDKSSQKPRRKKKTEEFRPTVVANVLFA